VIGVFDDRAHAVAAIKELYQAGFAENQIGIAGRHNEGNTTVTETPAVAGHGSGAATGAVTGAVAGASLGGLVGLGVTAGIIPVLGPVIAGGTLAVILANAAGGAAIGAAPSAPSLAPVRPVTRSRLSATASRKPAPTPRSPCRRT